MKKYFFMFAVFLFGPAIMLVQQEDLRKDDEKFFKGKPVSALAASMIQTQEEPLPKDYQKLVELFNEWREFESPPLLNGAPDYPASRFKEDRKIFRSLQKRLNKINVASWAIPQQIDWHVVRAEMNGYDFNYRVLRPWERDPAFYQTVWTYKSDVPAHEGPTNHAILELWTYDFPLFRTLGAIFRTPLTAVADTLGVQYTANDMITNTWQILYPSTPNHDHRMFLQIMAFTGNV